MAQHAAVARYPGAAAQTLGQRAEPMQGVGMEARTVGAREQGKDGELGQGEEEERGPHMPHVHCHLPSPSMHVRPIRLPTCI